MSSKHKAIVFTDFDGTITLKDSNDYLTDTIGYGSQKRREGNIAVLEGQRSFRDAFKEMLDSVKLPLPDCIKILRENIKLDPGFKDFYNWCRENGIPLIVVSSGMKPIIQALLKDLVGPEAAEIPIISNDANVDENGKWEIIYRDESHYGHDKSKALKPYRELPNGERPLLLYCGDGVSDLSAAKEADLLFAKHGHDLVTYCLREGVPFTIFNTFHDIHRDVKDIIDGKQTIGEVAKRGQELARLEGREEATTR